MFYEIGTCVQISQGWQAGRFVLQHYLQYSIYLPTIRTHDILRIIRLMTKFAQILRNLAPSWNLIRWRNNLIPASHVTPLYNSVHVHSNPLGLSTHVPLFIHGWLRHSSISEIKEGWGKWSPLLKQCWWSNTLDEKICADYKLRYSSLSCLWTMFKKPLQQERDAWKWSLKWPLEFHDNTHRELGSRLVPSMLGT